MPGIEIKGQSKRANYRHGGRTGFKHGGPHKLEPKSVDGIGKQAIKYEHDRPPQKRKLKIKQTEMDSIK